MRIQIGLKHFFLTSRHRRHVRYRWRCLVPVIGLPFLFIGVLLVRDRDVLRYIRRSPQHPEYVAAAWETFTHNHATTIKNLIGSEAVRTESNIPTLRLVVPKNTLEDMQRALKTGNPKLSHQPGGDKPYFKATLIDDDQRILNCKISLRGWGFWHHQPVKPSLRIKLRKADVNNGRRYYELQRPEDPLALANWIPMRLAEHLGLLSDRQEHVRLFINKKYFGVYLRTLRQGEPLAIDNGRMPGTFFKGEFTGDLWSTVEHWRIFGESSATATEHLRQFLAVLREPPSAQTVESLYDLLDAEVYARWAAVIIVSGSAHTDYWHNQSFFLSSNQGKLEAIAWDCNAYGMEFGPHLPPDIVQHPIMDMIIRDPRWVHRRNIIIFDLLNSIAGTESIIRLIDETVTRMLPDLKADLNLYALEDRWVGMQLVPWSVLDIESNTLKVKAWALQRHEFLSAYLSDARVFIHPIADEPGWSHVEVGGHAAVRVSRIDGSPVLSNSFAGAQEVLYPGLSETMDAFKTPATSRMSPKESYPLPEPLTYRIRGTPEQLVFFNALTGETVVPETAPLLRDSSPRTIHPSQFEPEKTEPVVLGPGRVVLNEDLHIGPKQSLVIQPGTQLLLAEGVGIYARGPVIAQGRSDAWIELRNATDKPWGAFGIAGPSTGGTRLRFVRMSHGSVGRDGGIQFKGMFSVYNCPDVVIRDCQFGRNFIGDDAVNLAESNIQVTNCTWDDALADGLDLDMCIGVVSGCRWRNSGNDGLDIMSGRITVTNSSIKTSGDKGISVGERATLVVRDSQISQCKIGLEVKDASRALVMDSLFDGNDIALHAYQKKWLYGKGGSTAMVSCHIRHSTEADLSIEKRCDVLLVNTPVAKISNGSKRVMRTSKLPAVWEQLLSSSGGDHVK